MSIPSDEVLREVRNMVFTEDSEDAKSVRGSLPSPYSFKGEHYRAIVREDHPIKCTSCVPFKEFKTVIFYKYKYRLVDSPDHQFMIWRELKPSH